MRGNGQGKLRTASGPSVGQESPKTPTITANQIHQLALGGLTPEEIAAKVEVSLSELEPFKGVMARARLCLTGALKTTLVRIALEHNLQAIKFLLKNLAAFSEDPALAELRHIEACQKKDMYQSQVLARKERQASKAVDDLTDKQLAARFHELEVLSAQIDEQLEATSITREESGGRPDVPSRGAEASTE